MDNKNPYFRQVELLVRILPLVGEHPCFALKGGTAINLFYRNMPRLGSGKVFLPSHGKNHCQRAVISF